MHLQVQCRKDDVMKHKILRLILPLTVAVAMVLSGGSAVFGETTDAKLPQEGGLKWGVKLSASSASPPIVEGDYIYTASGKYVYKLNKNTGAAVKKSAALSGSMGYTTLPLTCEEGMIFVPVYGGKIEVFSASDLSRIRIIDSKSSGQMISPVVYKCGKLYTGTLDINGTGTFFAADVSDGTITELANAKDGYYWAGAYVSDNYAVFGSEDGEKDGINGTAVLTSCRTSDGSVADRLELDGSGDIRSSIQYDDGYLYFTSKGGFFYKVELAQDGTLKLAARTSLKGASAGTPLLDGSGAVYVTAGNGGSPGSTGWIQKIYCSTMAIAASAVTPGVIQGEMLLSQENGTPVLYGAYNYTPGGICLVKDNGDSFSSAVKCFLPDSGMRDYAISSVTCDKEGVLYYTNDSGYIMAVSAACRITSSASKGGTITASKIVGSGAASSTFYLTASKYYYISSVYADGKNMGIRTSYTFRKITGNHTIKANFKKVPIPAGVKVTAGKKKASVKWKRSSSVSGYQVYRSTKKSSSYKKVTTLTSNRSVSYTNKKLKKGKTYYFKVRAYKKTAGETVYGPFTKVVKVKVK